MWLLPLLPPLASFAVRVFYRTTVEGLTIPRAGPLLLVGNHPNSLLDPLFLSAVARRPVRFLAKAPLFSNPWTGWAVRAVGAIPVYRRSDDPALVERNAGAFHAAHDALRQGAAVGIFPEGMSHDEPSLAPLRTGAARIALGARSQLGRAFPVVPIGIVLRDKQEFRSDAHVLVGEPVSWAGLDSGEADPATVKEMTARVDAALRAVTLNLERWEDSRLITMAEEIYAAEFGRAAGPGERVSRWRDSARILSTARRTGDADALALGLDVADHARSLTVFRLRPEELNARTTLEIAATWTARKIAFLAPLTFAVASIGAVLFWVPYRLTDFVVSRTNADASGRASAKLVGGGVLFIAWIALLSAMVWAATGAVAGLASLLLLPAFAVSTLLLVEQSRTTWNDARRFFLLRARVDALDRMRARQRALATRLRALYDASQAGLAAGLPDGSAPAAER